MILYMATREPKRSGRGAMVSKNAKEQKRNLTPEIATKRTLRKGELEEVLLKEEIFWR